MNAWLPGALTQRLSAIGGPGQAAVLGGRRLAPMVLLLAALLLLLFGLWLLSQSGRLAESVGEEQAQQQLRSSLEARLAVEGSSGLQAYVRALVDRGAMGLRYLSVRVPGGTVVAEASAYDSLSIPMISPVYVQRLRASLLAQAGERQRLQLQRDGQPLATVDYVLAGGAVAQARVDALVALRATAWFALALALLLAAGGTLLWLRPAPAAEAGGIQERLRPAASSSRAQGTLEARAVQALDRLQQGVIVVDEDARIRQMNRVAEQLTGWPREDAQGRLVYSVFHPLAEDDQPLTTPAETAAREGFEVPPERCRLRARDGTMHAVEMAAAPLRAGGDGVDGAVLFFRDTGAETAGADAPGADTQRAQDLVDPLEEALLTADAQGIVRFASARAARMFGYEREALVGMRVSRLLPVPFLNMPDVRLSDYRDEERHARLPRVMGWRQDASSFPVDLLVQPMTHGEAGEQVLVLRDLTAQRRNDNLSMRMGRVFNQAAQEIFIFDAQTLCFTEVNHAAQKDLGLEDAQLRRMTLATISDGLDADTLADYCARLKSGQVEQLHYRARHRRADGSSYPVEVSLSHSRGEEPPVFIAIASDLSEREAAEARIARQGNIDEVTGLANRSAALTALREVVLQAVQKGENLAVAYLDIDQFKRLNDVHGQEVGDAVLRELAQRLSLLGRDAALTARLSGDEFLVSRPAVLDRDEAEAFGERLKTLFDDPFRVGDRNLRLTASIGVAVMRPASEDPMEAGELVSQAERAMYLAKKSGRNRCHVYFGREAPAGLRGQSL